MREKQPVPQQALRLRKPSIMHTNSPKDPNIESANLTERLSHPENLSAGEVFSDTLAVNEAYIRLNNGESRLSYALRNSYDLGIQALIRSKDFDPQNNKQHELFFSHLSQGLLEQQRIIQTSHSENTPSGQQ